MDKLTKEEKSWIMYDCGNSAFSVIISTAIFPIYFAGMATSSIGSSASAAWWNYGNAISTLIIVFLSPILGAIADYKGYKKKLFTICAFIGIIFTGILAFIPSSQWMILLSCFVIMELGFASSCIFYDSFLVDITSNERMDVVSSKGFAYGYIFSVIPFLVCIALIQLSDSSQTILMTKISFVITAVWWGLFTLPMIKNVHQLHYIEREPNPVLSSFKRLFKTIKSLRHNKIIVIFLISYFFYIDGVNTIIKNAAVFGTQIGLDSTGLMIALLLTQIVAFPGAIIYGKLAKKYSPEKVILLGIITYFAVCIFAYFMKTLLHFVILGFMIASAQGGIQALSRSYYAKIIPKEHSNEYFGFYNIFGKFAAIMGPMLVGLTTDITGDIRKGILSLIIIFALGLFFFLKLPAIQAEQQ